MLVFAPAYRYPDWQYRFREGAQTNQLIVILQDTRIGRLAIQKVVHIRTRLHDIFMRIMLYRFPGVAKYTRSSIFAIYISRPTGKPSFALYSFIRTAFVKSLSKSTHGNVVCIVHPNHLIAFLLKRRQESFIPSILPTTCHSPFFFPNQINTVIYPDIHKVRTSCHKLATPGAGNIRHAFYGSAIDKGKYHGRADRRFITYTAKVPDLSAGLNRTDIRQIAVHLYRIRGVIQTRLVPK